MRRSRKSVLVSLVVAAALVACSASFSRSDGLPTAAMPDNVRGDYELFAQRCSKCHSLSRPLESGIVDDEYWRRYVDRMRRMPGSGITVDDEPGILRFLHYYSAEQERTKREARDRQAGPQ